MQLFCKIHFVGIETLLVAAGLDSIQQLQPFFLSSSRFFLKQVQHYFGQIQLDLIKEVLVVLEHQADADYRYFEAWLQNLPIAGQILPQTFQIIRMRSEESSLFKLQVINLLIIISYNLQSNTQNMAQDPVPIKLVIVGDGSVGKTCILVSFTENKFPTTYEPTVFDNFATTIKVDGKIVNLGLWDTAGQEQYNRLRPLAYPHCDVFLIAFSVIDPSSFINAKKKWFPELQECVPNAPKIFVGNKIDLRDQYQKNATDPKNAPITKETAKKIVEEQLKCKYIECSALTQIGLKQIFDQAVRVVLKKKGGSSSSKKTQGKKGEEGTSCNCSLI